MLSVFSGYDNRIPICMFPCRHHAFLEIEDRNISICKDPRKVALHDMDPDDEYDFYDTMTRHWKRGEVFTRVMSPSTYGQFAPCVMKALSERALSAERLEQLKQSLLEPCEHRRLELRVRLQAVCKLVVGPALASDVTAIPAPRVLPPCHQQTLERAQPCHPRLALAPCYLVLGNI